MDECLIINVNVLIFVKFVFFYVFTQRNIKGVTNLKEGLTDQWFYVTRVQFVKELDDLPVESIPGDLQEVVSEVSLS